MKKIKSMGDRWDGFEKMCSLALSQFCLKQRKKSLKKLFWAIMECFW